MKKSTIWLLTVVMAFTLLGLLFVQIMYLERMVGMRNQQFSEIVSRSLYDVSTTLERDETIYYLDLDLDETQATLGGGSSLTFAEELAALSDSSATSGSGKLGSIKDKIDNFSGSYQSRQEILRGQYLYQKELLNEVILTLLSQSSDRPITERADSVTVRRYLQQEFGSNGLDLPFEFAITNRAETIVYKTSGYDTLRRSGAYRQMLFPNDPLSRRHTLNVKFPTKHKYIFSSVKFLIPSLAFTLLMIVVFTFTMIVVFRQKRLSDIKNDLINNMTHEFKTPISTISLAAQRLNDDSVTKSPSMLKRVARVIGDETKRLRFQVEKVLQMSMFDQRSATFKLQDVDVNSVIASVANTYQIKVEKFGGHISYALDAEDSVVNVDEMHFTNVIFNLLDNAVKYRREDVPPELAITTRNLGEDRLEITISDNGIGIKKEDRKRIFEKFYRVSTGNRHDVKGFGLGLAYVHKMITLFNGTIRVESEVNKGSDFIITLPLFGND
ncbi:MAG: HAMP domain-containing histidine kinase [Muribaculaceae bacterium]|nr:HAMP domain-containing histidine kinase [Muribaculaceae bacterium]